MAQDKQELMDYILDHYEDPRNSGTITDADKVQNSVCQNGGNPGCGDIVTICLKVEDGIIKDFKFFNLGSVSHSHNHKYLAYNVDTNGSEHYDLSIEEIDTKKIITKKIENTTGEIIWHPNNKIIFYTVLDNNHRPNKIFAHEIGSDPSNDQLIYKEEDAAYFCSPSLSQSKDYLLIRTGDHQTSEYWFSQINDFKNIKCFKKRKDGEEYEIDHANDIFYILNNLDGCKNFKVSTAEPRNINDWKDYVKYNPNHLLLDFTVLKKWFILFQRVDGLNQILIKNLENLKFQSREHRLKQ